MGYVSVSGGQSHLSSFKWNFNVNLCFEHQFYQEQKCNVCQCQGGISEFSGSRELCFLCSDLDGCCCCDHHRLGEPGPEAWQRSARTGTNYKATAPSSPKPLLLLTDLHVAIYHSPGDENRLGDESWVMSVT